MDIVSDGAQCNDGSQSDVSDFRSKLQDRILQNKSSPRKLVLHTRRQDADSSKPARKRIKVKACQSSCRASQSIAACTA